MVPKHAVRSVVRMVGVRNMTLIQIFLRKSSENFSFAGARLGLVWFDATRNNYW